jgi:hypothetical protein
MTVLRALSASSGVTMATDALFLVTMVTKADSLIWRVAEAAHMTAEKRQVYLCYSGCQDTLHMPLALSYISHSKIYIFSLVDTRGHFCIDVVSTENLHFGFRMGSKAQC